MAEPALMRDYETNRDHVMTLAAGLLSYLDLAGQWSLDVMSDGKRLWVIDMAPAQTSAFYEDVVSAACRVSLVEDWMPRLPQVES